MISVNVFFADVARDLKYGLSNRAPAKHVALWEEEQTRSSSICRANSNDKRFATSERSYEVGPASGRCPRSTTKNAHTQVKRVKYVKKIDNLSHMIFNTSLKLTWE